MRTPKAGDFVVWKNGTGAYSLSLAVSEVTRITPASFYEAGWRREQRHPLDAVVAVVLTEAHGKELIAVAQAVWDAQADTVRAAEKACSAEQDRHREAMKPLRWALSDAMGERYRATIAKATGGDA